VKLSIQKNLKISIITICFNSQATLEPTIQSVINQTYKNIEYIIIDGASNDKTVEIIEKYDDHISKWISEPDKGIYDAINKGLKLASGDIVGLIHSGDCLYEDLTIEKIADHFESNDIDAIYGHSKIYSDDGENVVRINKSPHFRDNLLKIGWFPSHQSFYAKRELFEQYGLYSLHYKIAADYELFLRFVHIHKININLLDEFIVKFSLGGISSSGIKSIISHNKECVAAWRDNNLKIPFYTIPLKLSRKIKQFILAKM